MNTTIMRASETLDIEFSPVDSSVIDGFEIFQGTVTKEIIGEGLEKLEKRDGCQYRVPWNTAPDKNILRLQSIAIP